MEKQETAQRSPQLRYVEEERSWRGEDQDVEVVMTDEAFRRHTTAYLEAHRIFEPVPQQVRAAQQGIMQISYWHLSVGTTENDVHVRAKKKLQELKAPYGGHQ